MDPTAHHETERERAPERRLTWALGSAGALFLIAIAGRDLPAKALVPRDPPTRTEATLVFGGDPGYERTKHATRLYHLGLTDVLVLCGGDWWASWGSIRIVLKEYGKLGYYFLRGWV